MGMATDDRKTDREMTPAEANQFMKACYQDALEQDLRDCWAALKAYDIKCKNLQDCLRILEHTGREREAKMALLQKNLEALEIEALKLAMVVHGGTNDEV